MFSPEREAGGRCCLCRSRPSLMTVPVLLVGSGRERTQAEWFVPSYYAVKKAEQFCQSGVWLLVTRQAAAGFSCSMCAPALLCCSYGRARESCAVVGPPWGCFAALQGDGRNALGLAAPAGCSWSCSTALEVGQLLGPGTSPAGTGGFRQDHTNRIVGAWRPLEIPQCKVGYTGKHPRGF